MEEIVANEFRAGGFRYLKMIGDTPFDLEKGLDLAARSRVLVPQAAMSLMQVSPWRDDLLDLYYLELSWPAREPMDIPLDCLPKKFRRMVVWAVVQGVRVSETIRGAAEMYESCFGGKPQFAFMSELPKGAGNFPVHGVELLRAEWAFDGCVMVGGKALNV
jgi:hypothetical protein